jgi:hypothetical protein
MLGMLREARSRWLGTVAWSNERGTGWLQEVVLVFLEIWMRAMKNVGGDKVRDLCVVGFTQRVPQRRKEDPLAKSRGVM